MQKDSRDDRTSAGSPVLVVNDEQLQLEILLGILKKGGIPCRGLGCAEEALNLLSEKSPPPLIITDLHMPGIDGWRFCRLLRSPEYAAFNHLPILVVSATFAGEDTRRITAATGANAFLPSPFNPEELLATVRDLIDHTNGQHRAKVLLVEDSFPEQAMLTRAFKNRGYDVLTASTAAEARHLHRMNYPEIIVLDYHLPDGTGEQLLQEFSKTDKFSVFVMITTDPEPALAVRWMKMGAAAYARKPFDAEYLLTLCESAARERVMMRIEEMLENKNQCLVQAQKMEAVGQLAGGVAHDFNNLLQIIHGYTSMALLDLQDEEGTTSSLQEVIKASERARRLVEQLLAYSRRQATQPESIDLAALIKREMEMVQRVIGEHIELRFVAESNLSAVHVDLNQVEQALLNLCINARDAMPEGGRLSIILRAAEFDTEYCATHRWARAGHYVCIEVADTGCGMSPEVREHIFEPFFTTKEMGKGTGLGLSTVYGITKQNNGFIHVYSEPDQGTTFRLYLPVDDSGVGPQVSKPDEMDEEAPGGTETILLAEDEDQVRAISGRYLANVGYRVLTAADGEEAVRMIAEHGAELDLLILDVVMPGKSGKQVLEAARARNLELPVLFVSGYSYETLDSTQLPAGAQLIQKPFSRRELLKAVRTVIGNGEHAGRRRP
jgi:DNA-binding response OmpR family regulator